VAQQLLAAKKNEDALVILKLNAEFNPGQSEGQKKTR
jgi:hypothetical protein